uniref:CAAX amino terminal protease n=1 Tax=Tanacetum cinerariifolium TaxID=118510 RepID=A0A699HJB0_TANCI|nr:CAAX amino terminal protease [Tanacetum cinerariifolium]
MKTAQRQSGERERCQFECISRAILRGKVPGNRLGLVVDRLAEATPSLVGLGAKFDQVLRATLDKIVTVSGPGFGGWQWRLATLPIKLGGLGILSAGDIIQYAFLASRLQTSNLQSKILSKTNIVSYVSSFQNALDAFNDMCKVDVLSLNTYASTPQMMKTLAKCYFGFIENDLVSRLAIPMFSEGSLCSSCNVHQIDQWGDHAVHCSNDVGVKFRHNLVRDILVDICSKARIMVRKDAPMGFLLEDGNDLRPALQTCMGANSWAHGVALHNAVEKKKGSTRRNVKTTDTSSSHLFSLRSSELLYSERGGSTACV